MVDYQLSDVMGSRALCGPEKNFSDNRTDGSRTLIPSLIILDFDGVLVDSENISATVQAAELRRIGVEISDADVHEVCTGQTREDAYSTIETRYGVVLTQAWRQQTAELYRSRLRSLTRLNDGAEALMNYLNRRHTRWCIATNGSRISTLAKISGTGSGLLLDHTRLICRDDVARGKPFPDLIAHAIAKYDARVSTTVTVDDTRYGIEAARSIGARAVWYCGPGAARLQNAPREYDASVDDLRSIPELIARL